MLAHECHRSRSHLSLVWWTTGLVKAPVMDCGVHYAAVWISESQTINGSTMLNAGDKQLGTVGCGNEQRTREQLQAAKGH